MELALPAPAGRALTIVGRALLGLYFIVPGIAKITGYDETIAYMAEHGVPAIAVLLPLTIVLQIGGGALLIAGRLVQPTALVLAGLTVVISLFMHDFWTMADGMERAHETQNFVKNLAITAGLMVLAGTGAPVRGAP